MGMTNREALKKVIVDNMKDEGIKTRADLNTLILVSIANSLAAIADVLTDRKENSNGNDD